MVAVSNAR